MAKSAPTDSSEDIEEVVDDIFRSHPPLPGHVSHKCTDRCWLLLFILACCGWNGVLDYAIKHGDWQRLSHGYNYTGSLCGLQPAGDYVFWCRNSSSGGLLTKFPVCVSKCAGDNSIHLACQQLDASIGGAKGYDARPFGKFCLPRVGHMHMVRAAIGKVAGRSAAEKLMAILVQVHDAKVPLCFSAVVAVLLGYLYIHFLDTHAAVLLRVSMCLLSLTPLCLGAYLLCASWRGGVDGISGTGDSQMDLGVGSALIGLGLAIALVGCSVQRALGAAVGCVEAAAECIYSEPSLLLEPFIAVALRGVLLVTLVLGFLLLFSCGDMEAGEGGVRRTFRHTKLEYYYLATYSFMSMWLAELCVAVSQYVLAFVTQRWYFTPYVNGRKVDAPRCALFRGYCNVVCYHLGTMALGSLFMTLFRGPSIICGIFAAMESGGNPLGICIGKIFSCCTGCFKNFLGKVSKNAYMDVAITSSGYPVSAVRAFDILTQEVHSVAALHGSQFIFTLFGSSTITCAGSVLTFVAVRSLGYFNNPESRLFVSNPMAVAGCAALICLLIAASFMIVLDTVADTILYCFAIEKCRSMRRLGAAEDEEEYAQDQKSCTGGWWPFGTGTAEAVAKEVPARYAPPTLRKLLSEYTP